MIAQGYGNGICTMNTSDASDKNTSFLTDILMCRKQTLASEQ